MKGESEAPSRARLILVGVRGFGRVHAERIERLTAAGEVTLVAAVDPAVATEQSEIYGASLFADLGDALAAVGPVDVVVIAAPLAAHFPLAEVALRAGADVYLEKPPVTSLDEFERLLAAERDTGRVVQVGFQSLGSHALELLRTDAFGIGAPVEVSAFGAWTRSLGYWTRSPWAGKRSLGGRAVIDGVVTNPLAHSVATALAVAGCRTLADVASVETDLYRANAIDADDTSVVRVTTSTGLRVTCALTLCSPEVHEPEVRIVGAAGRAVFAYTTDRVTVSAGPNPRTEVTGRTDLVENLLAHRRDGEPLLVPLASAGAFMRVMAAVAGADEPVRVDPLALRWEGEGTERATIIPDAEYWLDRAASTGRTLTELGVPWAHPGRDTVVARALVDGTEVASYRDGAGTIPTSTPRPYLHPLRTFGGVVVSAHHPADHDWHCGVGMAIPDVNASHFWGGRTYVHGEGYVWRDNLGVIRGAAPEVGPDGLHQSLEWLGHSGRVELSEQRRISWAALPAGGWRLELDSELVAPDGAVLNSPGSKGRVGGGYGGFFWRFPACRDVAVFTQDADGEESVHGTVAPWIAWSADFEAGPGVSGPATIVVAAPDALAAGEPWFVRARDYPGLGSSLAWDRPVSLAPGGALRRRFVVAVVDGRLDPARVAAVAADLGAVHA